MLAGTLGAERVMDCPALLAFPGEQQSLGLSQWSVPQDAVLGVAAQPGGTGLCLGRGWQLDKSPIKVILSVKPLVRYLVQHPQLYPSFLWHGFAHMVDLPACCCLPHQLMGQDSGRSGQCGDPLCSHSHSTDRCCQSQCEL